MLNSVIFILGVVSSFQQIQSKISIDYDYFSILGNSCIDYSASFDSRCCCKTASQLVADPLKSINIMFLDFNALNLFRGERCFCKARFESFEKLVRWHSHDCVVVHFGSCFDDFRCKAIRF